jgi:hypothetical protein
MTSWEALGSYRTNREAAALRWQTVKPAAVALLVGLVAGPYISNALGWQVTSGTAADRTRAGIVAQLASICDARAYGSPGDPGKLSRAPAEAWRGPGQSCPEASQRRGRDDRMRR